MLETAAESTFVKSVKDTNSDSAKESKGNSLYDCAYDRNATSLKSEQKGGDKTAASLPALDLVGDGKESGTKPHAKNPSPPDSGAGDAGSHAGNHAGGPGKTDKTNGTTGDAMASTAKPPVTDGSGAIAQAASDGTKPGSGAHDFKPTPAEFQFSTEKTAAAALNMFAKDELDLNGDGFVNKVELSRKHDELAEAAKKNPKSKEIVEKQQAVNLMIWDYEELSKAHDDEIFSETSGITIHDLASTVSAVNKGKHSGN